MNFMAIFPLVSRPNTMAISALGKRQALPPMAFGTVMGEPALR